MVVSRFKRLRGPCSNETNCHCNTEEYGKAPEKDEEDFLKCLHLAWIFVLWHVAMRSRAGVVVISASGYSFGVATITGIRDR
jgi:hypothetical protein